jgi:predicted RNA-binding protein with TRAM domain
LVSDGEHYRLSRKTESRKGEQMKRIALLSVVTLMLASAIFAPVALAQQTGEVDVQSVTLTAGGAVTVKGTLVCVPGSYYDVTVDVRQRTSGNVYNIASVYTNSTVSDQLCPDTGLLEFQASGFGRVGEISKPFHRGPAIIEPRSYVCDPSGCKDWQGTLEAVHIS